ncbi:MAG TPA: DUF2092 domain-containing protein [Puia sp.]|nr:DUF2092 domain-containing protein [Puia sp.]
MYKKLFFVLLFGTGGLSLSAQTQTRRIDTVAVSILDRMSAMIGDLNSCSVTVKSNYDIISHQLGLVKHSDEEQLYLHGPNKLLLRSDGDKGSRDFYFNGQTLSYYSLDKNQYGQIEAPVSVIEMIDTVNKLYGIDFPIADFFYPSFIDDLLAESGNLVYLGLTKVNGKECFHIAGTAKDKTYQFWVSNDAFNLPMKVVIVYTGREMTPQYEAVLSDWQVNPTLPDAMFEFAVPNMARRIKLVPVNTKVNLKK